MALLTTPEKATVTIHTNSAAAIQLIQKCDSKYSSKKWLGTHNMLWVMYIENIVREKHLILNLVKVQGHSGDRFNDLADDYAKLGGISENVLDIDFVSVNSKLKILPHFHNHPIEQKIRKFTISTLRIFNCAEWTRLQSQRSNFSDRQISWKSSWTLFKNLTGFRCNRVKKNTDWAFAFKVFHKALPLGHLLKLRRPDLYGEMGCVKCGSPDEETWTHFISCDPQGDAWKNLHTNLTLDIRTMFRKHAQDEVSDSQIDILILTLIGPVADSTTFQLFKQSACEGKLTCQQSSIIKKKLRLSSTSS